MRAKVEDSALERPTRKRTAWLFGVSKGELVAGLICLGAVLLLATLGSVLTRDPFEQAPHGILASPGSDFLLGADQLGRDSLSRIAAGTRYSLAVAIGSLVVGGAIGTVLGGIAGFFTNRSSRALDSIFEFLMSFPGLLFGIVIAAVFGNNLFSLISAISLALIPRYAAVVRAETLGLRHAEFVLGAEAIGVAPLRIMVRHILRNIWPSIALLGVVYFPLVVTFEASLSYLGLGVPPDVPTLGRLIAQGQEYFMIAPRLAILPGVVLLVVCLGFNLVSDALGARSNFN